MDLLLGFPASLSSDGGLRLPKQALGKTFVSETDPRDAFQLWCPQIARSISCSATDFDLLKRTCLTNLTATS
jgi:hypothetical protein